MCKSAKKVFEGLGVEVFDIGARQCRALFAWNYAPSSVDYYRGLLNRPYCDTMRKGSYLVVVGFAKFGHMFSVAEVTGDGTVRSAEWEVRHFQYCDSMVLAADYSETRYQHHVEVWHLVDDDDLWGDWERRVLDSRWMKSDEMLSDGRVDVDGCVESDSVPVVEYEHRLCGSSLEYLSGVWVPEVGHYVTVRYCYPYAYPDFAPICVDDWHASMQPTTFSECDDYGWIPWPMDEILEVDLPCSDADWRIIDETGCEYNCMDLEDVRGSLSAHHMVPLFTECGGMYGDPAEYPYLYRPIAVVEVHACTL